jgi:hypothetical protein
MQPEHIARHCDNEYATTCGESLIYHDLISALSQKANQEKVIVLAGLIDGPYIDMAINLHISSIAPFKICNIIYISIDRTALKETQRYNMPVYFHNKNITNKSIGAWKSGAFNEKSKIKLEIVLMVLKMGYTVLMTDLDMVFISNPFLDITCGADCDFAIQDNSNRPANTPKQVNSGFLFIKSNSRTIQLYEALVREAGLSEDSDDQDVFNRVLDRQDIPGLHFVVLPRLKYCVGKFHLYKRCIVYHANYAIGVKLKIERLKNNKVWFQGRLEEEMYKCTLL